MSQNTGQPGKGLAIAGIVAGCVFGLLAIRGLVFLPSDLTQGDGATAAGALAGVLVFAALAIGFLIGGIRRYKRTA